MPSLVLALLVACTSPEGTEDGPPAPPVTTPTETPTTPSTPTPTTPTSTGPTADTGLEVTGLPTALTGDTATATGTTGDTGSLGTIDCAVTAPAALASRLVPGARGYHGLVINDDGEMVGSDGSTLVAADSTGAWRVVLPGTGSLQQLDRLSDGTIIAGSSSDGQVFAVAPNGAVTPLASISAIYGIRVGPDDKVYVANQQVIYRVDPTTGQVETWLDSPQITPKVLDFSHDLTKVYIGTNGQNGDVFSIDVDAAFDPIAPPVRIAQTPGSWHDGLTVDVCGNLYVAEYFTSGMYNISPSGNVSTLFIAQGGAGPDYYGHGVMFGTGRDGWPADAIYFPQPYNGNTVSEVIVGLPHRTWGGTVLNAP